VDINALYEDVTTGGTDEYTLEYAGEEFTFELQALTRTRKNEVLAALPQGFLDPTGLPEGVDPEAAAELSDEELIEKIEAAGGDVGDLVSGQLLDAEATEVAIDAMVTAYSHPKLADRDLENILSSSQFPDREFMQMLNKMINVSSPDDAVRDFRGET
jgi:hypothetical protein